MPARRELTMRQLRQMLRLARDGVSARGIGRTLGVARSTIQDNLMRAEAAGLVWPLGPEITDAVLEQRLFARAGVRPGLRRRAEPDWPRSRVRRSARASTSWCSGRSTGTFTRTATATAASATSFREFERRLSPVMRQHHAAARGGARSRTAGGSGPRRARPRAARCGEPASRAGGCRDPACRRLRGRGL